MKKILFLLTIGLLTLTLNAAPYKQINYKNGKLKLIIPKNSGIAKEFYPSGKL